MRRSARVGLLCLAFAIPLLTGTSVMATKPDEPSAAPLPIQIATARKIFISYPESDADPGAPNLTYNEFYALMKRWGKYELLRAPAEADLVFEIRFVSGISGAQLILTSVVATRPACRTFIPRVGSPEELR